MSASGPPSSQETTPSQKKKRTIQEILDELDQYDEEELFKGTNVTRPQAKKPKLHETEDSNDSHASIAAPLVSSTLPTPVTAQQTAPAPVANHADKEVPALTSHDSQLSGLLSPSNSTLNTSFFSADDDAIDEQVEVGDASEHLTLLFRASGIPFDTFFPYSSKYIPQHVEEQAKAAAATQPAKPGAKHETPEPLPYVVTRVHHAKSTKEYEKMVNQLKQAKEMVVLSYNTNGDAAKEFSSTRGAKENLKTAMVPAMNLKEQIQVVALRIDDENTIYEVEIAPQTSNVFALMTGAAKSGVALVPAHVALLWDILHRRIISKHVQLVVYNTQRFLRLLEMHALTSPQSKTSGPANAANDTPLAYSDFALHAFQEPPLDPFVAGFILNPEMGVEPDAERTALSMRSYEFLSMMHAYCPHIKLHTRAKNQLADDTYFIRDLCLVLWEALRAEHLLDAFVFEMRVAAILAKMEAPGMTVDLQALDEPRKAIDTKLKDLSSLANQIVGHDILLSSPSQVAEAIYHGLEEYLDRDKAKKNSALKKTSTGKHQSTREAALLELKKRMKSDGMTEMRQYKICEIVLEHRPISKLLSFLEAVEQTAEKTKSARIRMVYPRWLQCNTGSGRITGASPNMQCQPTTDEIKLLAMSDEDFDPKAAQFMPSNRFGSALESGASVVKAEGGPATIDFRINIRSAYVARPGYKLVGADYSQIEMRILAQVSGDEQLVHFFQTGMDIHRQVASRVFKIPAEQVTSQQREWCKHIVYGIVYGMGIQALSKSLDITSARGKEFYDSFMGSFPNVQKWINTAKSHIRSTFAAHTMLGRVRKFMPGSNLSDTGRYLRQGVNTIIQGSAADIVKLAMVHIDTEIYNRRLDSKLLLQIHDELIYEVLEKDVEAFKAIMKEGMEGAVPHFDVPLTTNIETGTAWGLMSP